MATQATRRARCDSLTPNGVCRAKLGTVVLRGKFHFVELVHSGSTSGGSRQAAERLTESYRKRSNPASLVAARPVRFERTTFGFGGRQEGLGGVSRRLQVVEKIPVGPTPALQESQGLAPVSQRFGAMVVQVRTMPDTTRTALNLAQALLTVREAASLLKVNTATIYKLVRNGELRHVRVGNSIRVLCKD